VVVQENTIKFTSTIDNTTVSCFFISHKTEHSATRKIFCSVDFLVVLYPTKLASI